MPQRTLVPNAAACTHRDRTLATRIQRGPTQKSNWGGMTPTAYAQHLANTDIISPGL
ncbi:transposase (fragment) [Xanthomonas citri pv. citri]